MTNRDLDDLAAQLSRRQHGAFAGRQLLAAGATQAAITRRAASCSWLRLDIGVYALPGVAGTWKRQVKASELGHPGAIVSGASAAVLHDLPGLRPGRPEITIPHGTRHTSRIAKVRRRDGIAACSIDGFQVTDVAQTILDLAPTLPADDLSRVVEAVLLRGAAEVEELAAGCLAAGQRRIQGAGRLRSVLDRLLGGAVAESELERALRGVVVRSGIGPVVYQASPPWWPEARQRFDGLLPDHLTILEADGRAWHSRVADFERDRERDNLAAIHGYRVVRLTWHMLTTQIPATVQLLRVLPRASISTVGAIKLGGFNRWLQRGVR